MSLWYTVGVKEGRGGWGLLVSRKVELRMQDSLVWNVVTVTSQLNGDWTADSYFSLSSVKTSLYTSQVPLPALQNLARTAKGEV